MKFKMIKPLLIQNLVDMKTRNKMRKIYLFQLLSTAVFVLFGTQWAQAQCMIVGDTSACPTATETYSIDNPIAGEVYTWSLSAGGTFVGSNVGTSVDVLWGPVAQTNTVSAAVQNPGPTMARSQQFNTECMDYEGNAIALGGPGGCPVASDATMYQNAGQTFIQSQNGAQIAVINGLAFDQVTQCNADTATYSSLLPFNPFNGPTTFVIRTGSGNFFKLGNAVSSATEVTYDWASLGTCNATSCSLDVVTEGDETLACNDLIHISLDEVCNAALTADMLLEGETLPNSSYIVTVYDNNGAVIPNATLTSVHLGMRLQYRVTQECTGNTCWGHLLVEDKLIPDLICSVDTLETMCGEGTGPEVVGFPLPIGAVAVPVPGQNEYVVSGFDPCGDVWLRYSDDVVKNGCGAKYYTVITRTWEAEDGYGNKTTCTEAIGILPGSLANVMFPPNFDGITKFALECDFKDRVVKQSPGIGLPVVNMGWNTLANGLPSPFGIPRNSSDTIIGTGYPTGIDCDHIAVSYRDRVIETCGPNTYKLFRTFKVYDWCTGETLEHLQLIKVVDTRAPQVICPPSVAVEIVPTTPWTCTGTFVAPAPIFDPSGKSAGNAPVVTQECNGYTYTVRHKIAPITGNNPGDCPGIPSNAAFFTGNVRQLPSGLWEVFDMPFGCNWIEYTITDDCGNSTMCRFDVFVEDQENPVAVCDEHTVVSLNELGQAKLCAPSVDNGSQDNCTHEDSLRFEVKRMGESDSRFRDCIDLTCADVAISPIMIVFRVYDKRGNYNDCMVEATIQDKIPPTIECPDDIQLECDEDYTNDQLTGIPTTNDQCGSPTLKSEIIRESLNDCGIGFVIKRWTVTDAGGRFAICDQRIDMVDSDLFDGNDIDWPTNVTIDGCTPGDAHPNNLPTASGWPEYRNKNCAKPVAGYEDEEFYDVNGLCIFIKRTWEVIDWCQYNVLTSTGPKWTYVQEIGIRNNVAPVIENGGCENRTVCTNDECVGRVTFNMTANDDCTLNKDLEWTYIIRNANTNAFIDQGIGNTYDEVLDRGRYQFTWKVKDACGNEDDCISVVTVEDCKEPTPYCKVGIITTIMPSTGYVEIWATDFNDGSFDNCTDTVDLRYSFSSNTGDIVRRITCDSLANGIVDTFSYQMWVTDLDGNQDYCTVTIIIQDNQDRCPDTGNLTSQVSGLIKTVNTEEVENVEVNLLHNDQHEKMMATANDGEFVFDDLTRMDQYAVQPYKNDDQLNGVSTADLVLIQRHLLGLKTFDSPYKYIAADANDSESVTAGDISELRKLILGAIPELRKNTSWRFVQSEQTFPDPTNPWLEGLKEEFEYLPLAQDMMDSDFRAIKVGDVNHNAVAHNFGSSKTRSSEEMVITMSDQVIGAGESAMIGLELGEEFEMNGIQFTLDLGSNLDLLTIESDVMNITAANYNYTPETGLVTFSWGDIKSLEVQPGATFLEVNVVSSADVNLSSEIAINSEVTKAEAYDIDLVSHEIKAVFRNAEDVSEKLTLYQNIPNPFSASTLIPFELPNAAEAELSIFDVNGQVLLVVHIEGQAGYNEFEVTTDQLAKAGVLYYQIESNQQVATKRMLMVK